MIFPVLRKGDSGHWVRHLQDIIRRNGQTQLVIDGSFGPATETAVKYLQVKHTLEMDGVVTEKVWEKFSENIYLEGRVCKVPNITESIIPITNGKRTGEKQTAIDWVIVHNTANKSSTAIGERFWLINPSNDRVASWHYAVDYIHAVLAIPEDEVAWHASNYSANKSSIGIESCESGDLKKTWDNTVGLAALQLFTHNLDISRLTTHNRWNGKNCPNLILPVWVQFAADVQATLKEMIRIANGEPEPVEEPVVPIEPTIPVEPIEEPADPVVPDEELLPEDDLDMGVLNRIFKLIELLLLRLLGRK